MEKEDFIEVEIPIEIIQKIHERFNESVESVLIEASNKLINKLL